MQRLLIQIALTTMSFLIVAGCIAPLPNSQAAQVLTGATRQPQPTSNPQTDKTNQPTAEEQLLASLPSRGEAPELTNAVWLNSTPLKLADLRGKVVMIKFWTFG